jgi:hypothetical protein
MTVRGTSARIDEFYQSTEKIHTQTHSCTHIHTKQLQLVRKGFFSGTTGHPHGKT